jgi:hypothetical protein
MYKYILIMLMSFNVCFAGWPNHDQVNAEKIQERYLFHPKERCNDGVHIAGAYISLKNGKFDDIYAVVNLRWKNGLVDYAINIYEPIYLSASIYKLELLDEYGFEISAPEIARVVENWIGTMRGSFAMDWHKFKNVKKFAFSSIQV